ncbi:T9SS type A sorting domain-containing protein [Bacteroidota bacterium]
MNTIRRSLAIVWLALQVVCGPSAYAQHIVYHSPCVDTRFGRDANCTANDSSDEAFAASIGNVEEDCASGTVGYATLDIDVIFSLKNAATRYDVGAIVNQEGLSAKSDTTSSCAARHLLAGNPNAFNVDGDLCADRQTAGNILFTMEDVQVKCPGAPGGDIVISMCRVWDQNAHAVCNSAYDLKPGTTSKCSCGDFVLGSPIQLPVELSSFTGEVDGSSVTLRWTTASETDNAGFAVEHASGDEFREDAFVTGRGTTLEPSDYSYRFTDLHSGRHRFRLKQIDYDGRFTYAAQLESVVEFPGTFRLESAYPNPFAGSATIDFLVSDQQEVTMELFNILGMPVRTLFKDVVGANTRQSVQVDGSGLSGGVYLIRLTGSNFESSQQIVLK